MSGSKEVKKFRFAVQLTLECQTRIVRYRLMYNVYSISESVFRDVVALSEVRDVEFASNE